jgi:Flp pilus assembly protein CpaB
MNTMVRPPTTRASGGRRLLLLGVLLALGAGIMVMYAISHYTNSGNSQETVVVAAKDLTAGTVLTAGAGDATHMPISQAFTTKSVNVDFAPANAYVFTSREELSTLLNNQVVVTDFYAGEILRKPDPRLVAIGTATSGSLSLINPSQIAPGDIIVEIQLSTTPAIVPGDHVDVLVTECNLQGSKDPQGCETQDTLQNIYVYTVRGNFVFVVLTHQKALELKYLAETGQIELAVRAPGDSGPISTQPVNAGYVVKDFNF